MTKKLDIYYKDRKIGIIKDGLIFSKDPDLNALLKFTQDKGWLKWKVENGKDKLQYSKDPKDFWEFLQRSGFFLVKK